jgi:hypothetical protein
MPPVSYPSAPPSATCPTALPGSNGPQCPQGGQRSVVLQQSRGHSFNTSYLLTLMRGAVVGPAWGWGRGRLGPCRDWVPLGSSVRLAFDDCGHSGCCGCCCHRGCFHSKLKRETVMMCTAHITCMWKSHMQASLLQCSVSPV